jgi:hypothetical protein
MKRLATFGVGSSTYLLVVVGTHHHAVGRRAGADAHRVHPNWSPRTVCGREWHVVADADDDGELVGAPDCRACLRGLTPRPSS